MVARERSQVVFWQALPGRCAWLQRRKPASDNARSHRWRNQTPDFGVHGIPTLCNYEPTEPRQLRSSLMPLWHNPGFRRRNEYGRESDDGLDHRGPVGYSPM